MLSNSLTQPGESATFLNGIVISLFLSQLFILQRLSLPHVKSLQFISLFTDDGIFFFFKSGFKSMCLYIHFHSFHIRQNLIFQEVSFYNFLSSYTMEHYLLGYRSDLAQLDVSMPVVEYFTWGLLQTISFLKK